MNSLKNFVLAMGGCFAVPTFFMVLLPYSTERNRQPVPYVMEEPGSGKAFDDEGLKGLYYPSAYAGDRARGAEIYGREGCAQCHTQLIRPDYAGVDQFKVKWGADLEGKGTPTRQTIMWDYMHENFAMLGQRRIGPDLANAGYRVAADLNAFYVYLYAPRARHEWSNSPGYKHLFKKRLKEGDGSADAIKLPANLAPEEGYEIVPTSEAKALAEYMLGLKRDQPVPVSITKAPPKPAEKK